MTDRAGCAAYTTLGIQPGSKVRSGAFLKEGAFYLMTRLSTYAMLARNAANTADVAWSAPYIDWDGNLAPIPILAGSATCIAASRIS